MDDSKENYKFDLEVKGLRLRVMYLHRERVSQWPLNDKKNKAVRQKNWQMPIDACKKVNRKKISGDNNGMI